MILAGAAAWLLLAFGGDGDEQQLQPPPPQRGSITVRQQIIIRVPVAGAGPPPRRAPALIQWHESSGPALHPRPPDHRRDRAQPGQRRPDLPRPQPGPRPARAALPGARFYRGFYVSRDRRRADLRRPRLDPLAHRRRCQIDQFRTPRPVAALSGLGIP